MNEVQIFNNAEFGEIRTVMIEGEPWFAGKDIATTLGYKDTADALKRHIPDKHKLTRCFTDSGQNREMIIIDESGLYRLMARSKLKAAENFQDWIFDDVIPTLRKTGKYAMPKAEENADQNSISGFLSMLSDDTKNAIIIDLSSKLAADEGKKAKRKETIRKRTEALKSLPDNIYSNRKKLREEILAFTKEFKTSAGKAYRDLYKILESEFGIKVVKGENKLYVESIPADKWDDVFKALDLMKNRNAA